MATDQELSEVLAEARPERRAGSFGRVAGELGDLERLQGGGVSELEGFTELWAAEKGVVL